MVMVVMTFNYSCTPADVESMALNFAASVKPVTKGLAWKVFLQRPEDNRSGGVYLFRDRTSAAEYLDGEYVKALRESPVVGNVSAEVFDVMLDASIEAGAPLG